MELNLDLMQMVQRQLPALITVLILIMRLAIISRQRSKFELKQQISGFSWRRKIER
jgi:hypothetical protein